MSVLGLQSRNRGQSFKMDSKEKNHYCPIFTHNYRVYKSGLIVCCSLDNYIPNWLKKFPKNFEITAILTFFISTAECCKEFEWGRTWQDGRVYSMTWLHRPPTYRWKQGLGCSGYHSRGSTCDRNHSSWFFISSLKASGQEFKAL